MVIDLNIISGKNEVVSISIKEDCEIFFNYQFNWIDEKTNEEEKLYLASDSSALASFLADENTLNSEVFLLENISVDYLSIIHPLTLNTMNKILSIGECLDIKSNTSGEIYILNKNGEISYNTINIDARDIDFIIDEPFPIFTQKDMGYYARLKSLNGEVLPNHIPISSYENWEKLYSGNHFFKMEPEMEILFMNGTSLSNGEAVRYTITENLSLTFEENVNIENTSFIFSNSKEGKIEIKTSILFSTNFIMFDTPLSEILWQENQVWTDDEIFKEMNIKSYNGITSDLGLGGLGEETLISLGVAKNTQNGIHQNISFKLSGNVLSHTWGYSISDGTLRALKPEISITAGEAYFSEESVNSNGSIDLSKDTKLIIKDGNGNTRTYLVLSKRIAPTIPVVHITTESNSAITSKEIYIKGTFSFNSGITEYASVAETSMQIKGRGNSTWAWEKKPYKIKFDEKTSLFGLKKAKDWVLLANYSDRSLIRNTLASSMGRILNNLTFVPSSYPVDLYINGKYAGVYSLGENIEVNKGRVEIDESTELDTGYLIEIGGSDKTSVYMKDYIHVGNIRHALLKSPKEEILTKEHAKFIYDYCYAADQAVVNLTNYEDYIDMNSLVDWFLLHELSNNIDSSFRRSCYMTKEKGGKLKMGPPWDFDLAFGNLSKDNPNYNTWCSIGSNENGSYVEITWINYLINDTRFKNAVKARWEEVGDKLLETGLSTINKYGNELSVSQRENFLVWDILGKKAGFTPNKTSALKTYEEQLEYLRTYLKKRKAWMDGEIKNW